VLIRRKHESYCGFSNGPEFIGRNRNCRSILVKFLEPMCTMPSNKLKHNSQIALSQEAQPRWMTSKHLKVTSFVEPENVLKIGFLPYAQAGSPAVLQSLIRANVLIEGVRFATSSPEFLSGHVSQHDHPLVRDQKEKLPQNKLVFQTRLYFSMNCGVVLLFVFHQRIESLPRSRRTLS